MTPSRETRSGKSRKSVFLGLAAFANDFLEWFDRLRQGLLLIRRVEIEINSTQRPFGVTLAEDDGDVLIERDAMAELGAASFVRANGFGH